MQRKWEDQLSQKEERQQMDLFRWIGEKWKARAQLGDKRISQHEIDFLPAALEIRERPPHPASRVTAWTILPLFSIGVVWACLGKGAGFEAETGANGKNYLSVDGREIRISPSMIVSVEIKTGNRKVIDYFLSPLFKYKSDGIREI